LIAEKILEQNDQDGNTGSGSCCRAGSLLRRKMDVSTEARPLLKALDGTTARRCTLPCLTIRACSTSTELKPARHSHGFGLGYPCAPALHSLGKALLAFQPREFIEEVIANGLPRRTPGTLTRPQALRQELAAIRARGYAIEDEEIEIGLRSIAAVVRGDSGNAIAAIDIAGLHIV